MSRLELTTKREVGHVGLVTRLFRSARPRQKQEVRRNCRGRETRQRAAHDRSPGGRLEGLFRHHDLRAGHCVLAIEHANYHSLHPPVSAPTGLRAHWRQPSEGRRHRPAAPYRTDDRLDLTGSEWVQSALSRYEGLPGPPASSVLRPSSPGVARAAAYSALDFVLRRGLRNLLKPHIPALKCTLAEERGHFILSVL